MDPVAVVKTMWKYKILVLPIFLITMAAAIYVFQFGPRYYESSVNYALVNPKMPTSKELVANPGLEEAAKNNPFLRSSDPGLITDVLIARMNGSAVPERLKAEGLSPDYTVSEGINGNGFMITVTGNGDSTGQALATTRGLGGILEAELHSVQKQNGADDGALFTALSITPLDKATEQFSSRLRSVIMVLIGGIVLMFGAVSTGRSLEAMRSRHGAEGRTKQHRGRRDSTNVVKDSRTEPSNQGSVPAAVKDADVAPTQLRGHADRRTPEHLPR